MRSRELQRVLAGLTGRPESEIDQRTRVLRMMNEIPTGARGPWAPTMNAVQIAFHILALVARRVPDAAEVSQRLIKDCRYITHPEHADFMEPNTALAAAMVYMIEPPHHAGFGNFEILETGARAWLNIKRTDGRSAKLLFSAEADAPADIKSYELLDQATMGNRFVVGPATLVFLGRQIETDEFEHAPLKAVADVAANLAAT